MRVSVISLALAVGLLGCAAKQERQRTGAGEGTQPTSATTADHSEKAASMSPISSPADSPCLETLRVEREHSVLDEQRGLGIAVNDFATGYRAANIFPDTFVPVHVVSTYQVGRSPLLWLTEDRSEVVVNAAVLSDLQVVEVTKLALDTPIEIGSLTELGLGKIEGRQLLKFLIFSRVIATYIHIGSQLCIESETLLDGDYTAQVRGRHTYFTNHEHHSPLHFRFHMSASGVMRVENF